MMEEQDRTAAQHEAEIRALASQLQKVTAQLQVVKAVRVVTSLNQQTIRTKQTIISHQPIDLIWRRRA
jgi:hypothetical protein